MTIKRFETFQPATESFAGYVAELKATLKLLEADKPEVVHVYAKHPWPKDVGEKKASTGPLVLVGTVLPKTLQEMPKRLRGHICLRANDTLEFSFDKDPKSAMKVVSALWKTTKLPQTVVLAETTGTPSLGAKIRKGLAGVGDRDFVRRADKVEESLVRLEQDLLELSELDPANEGLKTAAEALLRGREALETARGQSERGETKAAYLMLDDVKEQTRRAEDVCRQLVVEWELKERALPLPNLPPPPSPEEQRRLKTFAEVRSMLDDAESSVGKIKRAKLKTHVAGTLTPLEEERLSTTQLQTSLAQSALDDLLKRATDARDRAKDLQTREDTVSDNVRKWGDDAISGLETALLPVPDPPRGLFDKRVKSHLREARQAWVAFEKGDFAEAERLGGVIWNSVDAMKGSLATAVDDYNAYQKKLDEAERVLSELELLPEAGLLGPEIGRHREDMKRFGKVADASPGSGWPRATGGLLDLLRRMDRTRLLAIRAREVLDLVGPLTKEWEEQPFDGPTATRLARDTARVMLEEGCTKEAAKQLALRAEWFRKAGVESHQALASARMARSLIDDGVSEERALAVGKNLRLAGTADVDDAVAVGKKMARLSTACLDELTKSGVRTEVCRGPVTEVDVGLRGVQPRGWPTGSTWDKIPGAYLGSSKRVIVGTMDKNGSRSVPEVGEGPCPHGTKDLCGHEAGHAYDVAGGGKRSEEKQFVEARAVDLKKGKPDGMYGPRDDYFLTKSEGGTNDAGPKSETFAESFGDHFSGATSNWPEVAKFWTANPYGI